jgi:hypothetical protein
MMEPGGFGRVIGPAVFEDRHGCRAWAVPTKTRSIPSARKGAAKKPRKASAATPGPGRRKVVVFASLLGTLGLTGALLLALAPAPLPAGAVQSLFAVSAPDSMDAIFNTATPLRPGRWNYIFVHQSKTISGNAATLGDSAGGLADHFLIGNGDGCHDGEVQIGQRWTDQTEAAPPPGRSIRKDCISICLVGDLDSTAPTELQQRRLIQLLAALQSRTNIPDSHIIALDGDTTSAGIGRRYSSAAVRKQLAGAR